MKFIEYDVNKYFNLKSKSIKPRQSPYGCVVSTLQDTTKNSRYKYGVYWLEFSAGVLESAKGKTKESFILGSHLVNGLAGNYNDYKDVVRVAHCIIPNSEEARLLVEKKLKVFDSNSWVNLKNQKKAQADTNTTQECVEYFLVFNCDVQMKSCVLVDLRCTLYDGSSGGSSGTGSNGGDGESSDPCSGRNAGKTDECNDDRLPGGGGGSIDNTPPPPEFFDFQDFVEDTLLTLDCSSTSLSTKQEDWCDSYSPTGEYLERTQNAIDKIRDRGSECAAIASAADFLLDGGRLRYWDRNNEPFGGFGGIDEVNGQGFALLSSTWIEYYYNKVSSTTETYPYKMNLDFAIVHETEHSMGRGHVNNDPYLTPNVKTCLGLY